uniref:CENP-V/GFA domain-containing protein n=1 Tax=Entomoneis paludosa TaxID=265537 RepID=A0A7S2YTI8_9STRA|mmetsp:Transcript_9469/g.19684  ORF Transcript_9469/g.19684 Transcript_9469/m.19684 type:complete len:131 (+) Transcript_9469:117-509(+)|eukprot:CAMPEP_0172447388 /NCGR_PEP_ID=MMETSP1065-20121228/6715_1 /TAXON_ID=265537 /ORGANISM="Amphiprora paludosa, Strain CCMP125" /LENGTH=130 /DNA_ID=CAMNT_0013198683 /DNA_START=33 /DNA_END=425 /DNA_ORIENTATION=-
MTTRTYTCMCGDFEGQVTGEPPLSCWCHCKTCRQQTGAPMQLGVWTPDNFKAIKGDDKLIKYNSAPTIYRNSCGKCGSFAYKVLPDGNLAIPLGALEPPVKPACNIMCAKEHAGEHPIMAPELPKHDAFP